MGTDGNKVLCYKTSGSYAHARTHTHTHAETHTCSAWLCGVLGRESLRLCLSEADSKVSNDSHLQRPVTSSQLSLSPFPLFTPSICLCLLRSLCLFVSTYFGLSTHSSILSTHCFAPFFLLRLLFFAALSLSAPLPLWKKKEKEITVSLPSVSHPVFFKPKCVCVCVYIYIYKCMCVCVYVSMCEGDVSSISVKAFVSLCQWR